ncbi:MAG TPA: hypothetical protein VGM82_04185 [Gemmatimonadaceae bacterium]
MQALPAHPLSIWESFYVIVGSSAAALTGLNFLVVAFVADRRKNISERTLSAFSTPGIIHFCLVLFVAATLSAPWPRESMVVLPLLAVGVSGTVWIIRTWHRMRTTPDYTPVFEDWVWHAILPLLAYVALTIACFFIPSHDLPALFVVAGASLLLMYIGIHAAWDTVTFIATEQDRKEHGDTAGT